MKEKIARLIKELESEAASNERLRKNGSPVTSMAEDISAGEIAKEQRRVIRKLKEIIK